MGDKLSTQTKFKNFGKLLTIDAIEESDEGKYMCIAKSSAGETVHYFDVIVEGMSTSGANYACICFLQRERDDSCFDSNQLLLTSPRAAKVADRASSEPADCDWV